MLKTLPIAAHVIVLLTGIRIEWNVLILKPLPELEFIHLRQLGVIVRLAWIDRILLIARKHLLRTHQVLKAEVRH